MAGSPDSLHRLTPGLLESQCRDSECDANRSILPSPFHSTRHRAPPSSRRTLAAHMAREESDVRMSGCVDVRMCWLTVRDDSGAQAQVRALEADQLGAREFDTARARPGMARGRQRVPSTLGNPAAAREISCHWTGIHTRLQIISREISRGFPACSGYVVCLPRTHPTRARRRQRARRGRSRSGFWGRR